MDGCEGGRRAGAESHGGRASLHGLKRRAPRHRCYEEQARHFAALSARQEAAPKAVDGADEDEERLGSDRRARQANRRARMLGRRVDVQRPPFACCPSQGHYQDAGKT